MRDNSNSNNPQLEGLKTRSQPNLLAMKQQVKPLTMLPTILPSPLIAQSDEDGEPQQKFTWPSTPKRDDDEEVDQVLDMQPIKQQLPPFLKHSEGIEAQKLCEILLDSQSRNNNLMILDARTFPQFNSQHIVNSHNIHLPALLLKRFRRGSISNLNIEVLICDDKGKAQWRNLMADGSCNIVLLDDEMPKTDDDWLVQKGTGLNMLMTLIDRDVQTKLASSRLHVFWLKSGFETFAEYCRMTSQTVDGSLLPNNRWLFYGIEVNEEQSIPAPLSAITPSLATPNKKLSMGLQRMSISISCLPSAGGLKSSVAPSPLQSAKGKPLKNILQAYRSSKQNRLSIQSGAGELAGPMTPYDEEDEELDSGFKVSTMSPGSPSYQKHLDCSQILDWLILGADPAVIRDSHSNPSSPGTSSVDDQEVWIEVPSPTNSRPASIMTSKIKASTPTTAKQLSASSTDSDKPVFTFNFAPSVEASPKQHGHHVNVKDTMANLKQHKVKYVVNLALECPDLSCFVKDSQEVADYAKLGMWDNTEADIEANVLHAISVIEAFHEQDKDAKIYVHCKAGRSRSATVVIAYLMKQNKWTVDEAYNYVNKSYSSDTEFPIQNIPFGIFSTAQQPQDKRPATRIGDFVVDLRKLANDGLLGEEFKAAFSQPTLNSFMAMGQKSWRKARSQLQSLLKEGSTAKVDLIPVQEVIMHLPAAIGDYTDFYASKEHATNVGIMFRGKENALMPNWTHLPVGYHGRASSIVVSGTNLKRPCGQRNTAAKGEPPKVVYGPSVRMDIELEMAYFIGTGNELGSPVELNKASEHIFGAVLMNDWSARDIQAWEYVPLGPFLGKNFGTSISPWIVTMDALEPFLTSGPKQDPEPLEYLNEGPARKSAYDIKLQVDLKPAGSQKYSTISKTNLKYMYWSAQQQLAHHTVNGCNMRPGDLIATGTISGPTEDSFGSLLELSWTGTKKLILEDGVDRTFLQDGDTVKLSGYGQADGYRIGFGDCVGAIEPALTKK